MTTIRRLKMLRISMGNRRSLQMERRLRTKKTKIGRFTEASGHFNISR